MPDLKILVPLGGGIGDWFSSSDVERFWSHVDIRGEDECWPWKLSCYHNGYGQFEAQGTPLRANRVAYELAHGPLTSDYWALHTCDNPSCCNPKHLFQGTPRDNSQDMTSKGRKRGGFEKGLYARERHPRAKLSESDVAAIRELYPQSGLTHREIAQAYGIHRSTVSAVLSRKNWRDNECLI